MKILNRWTVTTVEIHQVYAKAIFTWWGINIGHWFFGIMKYKRDR